MNSEANRLESLALNAIFALVSAILLAAIGFATGQGSDSAGWWTRPALAPGVALAILLGCNVVTLFRAGAELRAAPPTSEEWGSARAKLIDWIRPMEYLAYFAVYLWALHHVGYTLASIVFVQWLLYRVGLRTNRWRLAGLALVIAMVLVFRIGLGVWMPAPDVYDLLPEGLNNIATRWL